MAKAAGSAIPAQKKQEVHYESAGPTLLSKQPPTPKAERDAKTKMGWSILQQHLESRLASLRSWRASWWMQNWSDLAQYLLPRRSIWLTQSAGGYPTPNNMTRGLEINTSIVDPTGTFAARVCSSGLMSGLASPSRPWFKIVPSGFKGNLDAESRMWLDDIEDRMYTLLAGSNFYNSFAQECEDLVVYGTAPTIIYEDKQDGIRLYNPCVGEYYLASGATLRIDGLYRQFLMTVSQMVDFFGLEKCPPDIQKLWAQKGNALDQERIIAHSIEPNYGVDPKDPELGVVKGNFTWRETYWVFGTSSAEPLSMRGFVDQPFTCARWATQANDCYGRSPGMDVLPDIIQLQVETKRKAEAIEKQVRPPLVADMSLRNQPSSILPGHVTYVQQLGPQSGMRPIYEVQPDIRGMMEDLMAIQNRIKVGLFNDLFLMLEQAPNSKMTAYEVAQKMQEKLQVLGPVIEGLLSESLKPKLKRIYSIMKKNGQIPPPPDSLAGKPLDIEFVSMLALAAKSAATGGIERILSLVGNMAAVFPEAKDNIDVDATIRIMNDLLGNPEKVLHGPEVVAQTRQAQQQQAQGQTQMAAMQHGAQTANIGAQAAQTLSQTQVGAGGNALAMLLGK